MDSDPANFRICLPYNNIQKEQQQEKWAGACRGGTEFIVYYYLLVTAIIPMHIYNFY